MGIEALAAAVILCWADELASTNPIVRQEATGAMALARFVGAGNIGLIAGAAELSGMEPTKILDMVEVRAKKLILLANPSRRGRTGGRVAATRAE